MNKLKWKSKQSIHKVHKRTTQPREMSVASKDNEGGDRKKSIIWKIEEKRANCQLKKEQMNN